jgi:hypothetical protein
VLDLSRADDDAGPAGPPRPAAPLEEEEQRRADGEEVEQGFPEKGLQGVYQIGDV